PRFHRDQVAGARTAVQPTEEGRDRLVGMLLLGGGTQVPWWPAQQGVPHDVGGDAAVALELRGLGVVIPPLQRGVGDDDADAQRRARAGACRAAPLAVVSLGAFAAGILEEVVVVCGGVVLVPGVVVAHSVVIRGAVMCGAVVRGVVRGVVVSDAL